MREGERKMDVDNVAKSVLDGLNGIAYNDDDQVVALLVRKHLVKNATDERVEIEIREAGLVRRKARLRKDERQQNSNKTMS